MLTKGAPYHELHEVLLCLRFLILGGVLGSYRMSDTVGQKTGENHFTNWGIPATLLIPSQFYALP